MRSQIRKETRRFPHIDLGRKPGIGAGSVCDDTHPQRGSRHLPVSSGNVGEHMLSQVV